jgi:hypothetical protein
MTTTTQLHSFVCDYVLNLIYDFLLTLKFLKKRFASIFYDIKHSVDHFVKMNVRYVKDDVTTYKSKSFNFK